MQLPSPIPTHFFQPATLPPALLALHEALAAAENDSRRLQAAHEIVKEYFSFFGRTGMRAAMWLLLSGALGNKQLCKMKKVHERNNLFFFYEFTLMLIDAAGIINRQQRRNNFGKVSNFAKVAGDYLPSNLKKVSREMDLALHIFSSVYKLILKGVFLKLAICLTVFSSISCSSAKDRADPSQEAIHSLFI